MVDESSFSYWVILDVKHFCKGWPSPSSVWLKPRFVSLLSKIESTTGDFWGESGNASNSENSFEEKKNVQAPSVKDNGPAIRISLPVCPKRPKPVAPIPKPHQVTQKPEPSVPQAESAKQRQPLLMIMHGLVSNLLNKLQQLRKLLLLNQSKVIPSPLLESRIYLKVHLQSCQLP